jgi:hypothetical protein
MRPPFDLLELFFKLGEVFAQLLVDQGGNVDGLSLFVLRPFLLSNGQVLNYNLNFHLPTFQLLPPQDSTHVFLVLC